MTAPTRPRLPAALRWFNNRSVRTKLLGTFVIVCFSVGAIGSVGLRTAVDLKSEVDGLAVVLLPGQKALDDIREARVVIARDLLTIALLPNGTERSDLYTRLPAKITSIQEQWAGFTALAPSPAEKQVMPEFESEERAWEAAATKMLELEKPGSPGGNAAAVALYTGELQPLYTQSSSTLRKLIQLQTKAASDAAAQADATFEMALHALVAAMALSFVFALATGIVIARSISGTVARLAIATRQVAQHDLVALTHAAQALADGDLTQHVALTASPVGVDSSDELGRMAEDFNAMIARLHEMGAAFEEMTAGLRGLVSRVRASATQVAGSSQELDGAMNQAGEAVQQVAATVNSIAAGAQDSSRNSQQTHDSVAKLGASIEAIARGAVEQARQVQRATATASQMAIDVEDMARNVGSVAEASDQTRTTARHGFEAVRETVAGMAEISSVVSAAAERVQDLGRLGERIGAVVETIDDIAEQTNLLALNAAIEAARAGEHGRGFAVVADEVRKLAERSSRETKQISELIQQVQRGTSEAVQAMEHGATRVQIGSSRADEAGKALQEILNAVEATVDQVAEIAVASRKMTVAAGSVTESMRSISTVVEQNTSATQEMSAQAAEVTANVYGIAAVAEEQSASTEEVSAGTEEMTAQIEEISTQAAQLASTAEQLQALVDRFKLDASTDKIVQVAPKRLSRAA